MKIPLLSLLVAASLSSSVLAQPDVPGPIILDSSSAGPVTYTQWVDGTESPVLNPNPKNPAQAVHFLWSKTLSAELRAQFGLSKTPGVRYLRMGFQNPVAIGSVLIRGVGQVSVLKPGAAYPGNLADDSQWIPAQRIEGGKLTDAEGGLDTVAVWTLPEVVTTRAIRITHTAQPSDLTYGATVAAAILPARWANLAPQALAAASATDEHAGRLNDENASLRPVWENTSLRDPALPKTIAEAPEWAILTWPAPVTLGGVSFLGNEWGTLDVQVFVGPPGTHPRAAADSDWKTIETVASGKSQYPSLLDMVPVAFDAPVTTRALRIRFTEAMDEKSVHTHLVGHSMGGTRVSLSEWLAFEPLGNAPLLTAVIPAAAQAHAPIPVRFTLPEAGEVTLVIEDSSGKRIRNLISQTPFPKGRNVAWWDGTDDLGRDAEAAEHGIYSIPAQFVAPGEYTVRGLWHKPLDLRYEMVVNAPGDPPWPTPDGAGGWMTTHTPASSALFVPAAKAVGGQPLVYLGDAISEGGYALSWLNLDGKKVGGRGWIGGAWTGAAYLAGDTGATAEPDVFAYVATPFLGNVKYGINGKIEIRLTKLLANGDRPVLTPSYLCNPLTGADAKNDAGFLGGLAVHNGLLVFSQPVLNQLVFVDAKAGKILSTTPLQGPGPLAFDSQGRLVATSGKSLLRFTLTGAPAALPTPETLASNLEDPRGITVDSTDRIYVSDQGNSNQVKVFAPDGSAVTVIGRPGALRAGKYDPLHMNNPKGLAVDSNGRIWVTEDNFQPKRVSVWNADGTLWKAYYGGPRYGGGGNIDPKDKTVFDYEGMEFHLDWTNGTYDLARIIYRPGPDDLQLGFRCGPPQAPVYFNGHRYLSDAYNSSPTSGEDTVFLFLDNGETAVPVAAAGDANRWELLKGDAYKSRWPAGIDPNGKSPKDKAFFIWSDLNGDGQAQPDEITMAPGSGGGITIGDDGSFLVARSGTSPDTLQATRFAPVRFTDKGVPVYDLAAGKSLAPAQTPGNDGGDQILAGTDGWLVMTVPPRPYSKLGIGGALNGTPTWSYPSLWPGLHASHSSPAPDHPGMLVGTTRLLGDLIPSPQGSDAGPLFFLNSNQGDIYSFTQDGLFVAQLFQDVRQGSLWEMPVAQRDMPLNNLTLHDENFFPTVTEAPDGSVYLEAGGNMAVVRVDNLGTIRRIPPTAIRVTSADLTKAHDFVVAREAERQAAQGSGVLAVPLLASAPTPANWADAQWVTIDRRGVAAYFDAHTKPYNVMAAVTVAKGTLYASWKTGDAKLLQNAGDAPNGLFKTGGALDLMIGANPKADPKRADAVPGDERLLVAQVGGKTRALLYRPVVPGTPDKDKVPFTAPWHGISIDRVDDVSSQIQLTDDGAGNYEVAAPLSLLGLDPNAGMRIKGDIGILRGDGKETTQRVYWTNKATAIVSDVPSEAELTPRLWGTWDFEQK